MLDLLIITGSSNGIGAQIAKQSSSIAKKLILISSTQEISNIPNATCLKLNLKNYDLVGIEIKKIAANLQDIKTIGIVLCGAQLGEYGGLLSSDLYDWENSFKCNVLGNLAVIQGCSSLLPTAKLRVVFFAGGGAAYGYPEFSGYALTKVSVVRAVENLGLEFSVLGYDASIIALAPGAVETQMLAKVKKHGGIIKTQTDISEPTNFTLKFITDQFDSAKLNGRFIHVRDNLANFDNPEHFKLRRVQ